LLHTKRWPRVGTPTSSILSEFYLQYLKHNFVFNISNRQKF